MAELSSTIIQKQSTLLLWSSTTGSTGQSLPAGYAMLILVLPWMQMRQASGQLITKMDTIAVPATMGKVRLLRAKMILRKKILQRVSGAILKEGGL
jgi:hypothetical protein